MKDKLCSTNKNMETLMFFYFVSHISTEIYMKKV